LDVDGSEEELVVDRCEKELGVGRYHECDCVVVGGSSDE